MKRVGLVTRIKPGCREKYVQIHAEIWPEVVRIGHRYNLRNYTIFIEERSGLMFSYYEYVGQDFAGDMAQKNRQPLIQEWQALCRTCFVPVDAALSEDQQLTLEEIFHNDF